MHSFVNVCKIQTGGERYIKGLLWTVWPDGYIIFSISQFTAMKVCPMADGRPNLPECSKLCQVLNNLSKYCQIWSHWLWKTTKSVLNTKVQNKISKVWN